MFGIKYFQIVLGSRTPPVGMVFISGILQKKKEGQNPLIVMWGIVLKSHETKNQWHKV